MADELDIQAGSSLLRAPGGEQPVLQRACTAYHPQHTFLLPQDRSYRQQFSDMYFLRSSLIRPALDAIAEEAWGDTIIGGEMVRRVERVLDVRQGELCWVAGTVYMELSLKPNVLEDVSKDKWLSAPTDIKQYISGDGNDMISLEDDSGRIRIVGDALRALPLVTGCIVAAMGTENAHGELEVIDVKLPDLPPQPERWALSGTPEKAKMEDDDGDVAMSDTGTGTQTPPRKKIAIVSGLGFSSLDAAHALELDLLLEYLLGEALTPEAQQEIAQVSRLIIAGNSISPEDPKQDHQTPTQTGQEPTTRKAPKKYGYDASAYNAVPSQLLDEFLAQLLPAMPVTLMPGVKDPANASYPQQPIHVAMFPHSRVYVTGNKANGDASWLDLVTNPWEGEIEGWRLLGTGGQNVDDVAKYMASDNRLDIMKAMCEWRCCAPTAPDTLCSYPFQDNDPFVIKDCPHLFFAGCQPSFSTRIIAPKGQRVRLVTVPSFAVTKELVLVDMETLEVSTVKFSVVNSDQ